MDIVDINQNSLGRSALSWIGAIPSRGETRAGQPLNVLGGVANRLEKPVRCTVTVWGNAGGGWRSIVSKEEIIDPGEHRHVYFTIPGDRLTSDWWGCELEELELIVSPFAPGEDEHGALVWIKPQI